MQLQDLIGRQSASNGLSKRKPTGLKGPGTREILKLLWLTSIRRDDRDRTVASRWFDIWFDDCEKILYSCILIHPDFAMYVRSGKFNCIM